MKEYGQEEVPRRQILGNALTPFEHAMFGSGYEANSKSGKTQQDKINLGMIQRGEYPLNEDFFKPIGLRDGTLEMEQIKAERRNFPTFTSMLNFSLFTEESYGDLMDMGYEPEIRLAPFDPKLKELTLKKLQLRLVKNNGFSGQSFLDGLRSLRLLDKYKDLFRIAYPEIGQDFLTIGFNPKAISDQQVKNEI